MSKEKWAATDEPFLEVSTLGRVRVEDKDGEWEIAKPIEHPRGYLRIARSRNGTRVDDLVHRLVLKAFYGPPPFDDPEADHINNDKTDNRLINLRWMPRKANKRDAALQGQIGIGGRGFSDQVFGEFRWLLYHTIGTATDIAEHYNTSRRTVRQAMSNAARRHVNARRPDNIPFDRWLRYGSYWVLVPEYPGYEISHKGYARTWRTGNPQLLNFSTNRRIALINEETSWQPTKEQVQRRYDELSQHIEPTPVYGS